MKNTNNKTTKGLGRGISSLLGENLNEKSNKDGNTYQLIPIEFIIPGPWQPRKDFNGEDLTNLANSIREQGVIQPVILKTNKNIINQYFLIAGERRWRAAQLAKLHVLPAIIRDDIEDNKLAEIALVENIQRSELNPIEEAEAFLSLINKYNYKQEDLSKAVGKSRSYIANSTRLTSLTDLGKELLIQKKITIGQIRPLIGRNDCDQLIKIVIKKSLNSRAV